MTGGDDSSPVDPAAGAIDEAGPPGDDGLVDGLAGEATDGYANDVGGAGGFRGDGSLARTGGGLTLPATVGAALVISGLVLIAARLRIRSIR